jgi:hypothetical protein
MPKYLRDALERVLWTSVAAAVSAAAVYVNDLPEVWVPIGTVILTTLKVLVAKKVGDPNSAALLKG